MKRFKKIGLGFILLLTASVVIPLLSHLGSVRAAPGYQYIEQVFQLDVNSGAALGFASSVDIDHIAQTLGSNYAGTLNSEGAFRASAIGYNCNGSDEFGPTCEAYFVLNPDDTSDEIVRFVNYCAVYPVGAQQEANCGHYSSNNLNTREIAVSTANFSSGTRYSYSGSQQDTITLANPYGALAAIQTQYGQPDNENDEEDDEEDGGQVADTCESRSPGWGWLMCSGVDLIDSGVNWVDNQIQRLLEVNQDRYTNRGLQSAWGTFRNIAYIILIPIMLVMVIGTAIGVEAFSAYTVRKALPRMVVAIIFIALSWYFCVFLIGLSNAVGSGVNGLITAPFRQEIGAHDPSCAGGSLNLTCLYSNDPEFAGGAGILRGIATTAAQLGTILGLVIFLMLFGSFLLIAAGSAFIVLFAREMFILGLMLMAPLAILAWIFPGNDKLWKGWWGVFSKLLMMYPLIMGIIAVGRIFAWIINESGAGALEGSLLKPIMKMVAYLLPYAFIPFTFKFAGGVFANLAGIVNDKNKGLFDRARKGRADKLQRWGDKGMFNHDEGLRGKVNKATRVAMNAKEAGANPLKWKSRMGAHLSGHSMQRRDEMMEDKEYNSWKGYDQLNRAAAMSHDEKSLRKELMDSREYHTDTGKKDDQGNTIWALTAEGKANMERDIQKVEKMRRRYGNEAMRQATTLQAIAGGTATDKVQKNGKSYNMLELIASVAGNDRAVHADLVAKGRSAANQSGRVDQGGISFGDGLGETDKFVKGVVHEIEVRPEVKDANGNITQHRQTMYLHREVDSSGNVSFKDMGGSVVNVDPKKVVTRAARDTEAAYKQKYTSEESRALTRRKVYDRQGAGSLMHPGQKTTVVEEMAPIIMEVTEEARMAASAPNATEEQKTNFVAHMAHLKAVYESLNSTNPDKARIVQKQVTSQTIDVGSMSTEMRDMFGDALNVYGERPVLDTSGQAVIDRDTGRPKMERYLSGQKTQITYSEALQAIEGNGKFQQFRKEYADQFRQEAAAAAAAQAATAASAASAAPSSQLPTGNTPPGP